MKFKFVYGALAIIFAATIVIYKLGYLTIERNTNAYKMVVVYTKPACPYCVKAKEILKNERIPFREVNVNYYDKMQESLQKRTKSNTVPQIFIDDVFTGGCEELIELYDSGRLKEMATRDNHPIYQEEGAETETLEEDKGEEELEFMQQN